MLRETNHLLSLMVFWDWNSWLLE